MEFAKVFIISIFVRWIFSLETANGLIVQNRQYRIWEDKHISITNFMNLKCYGNGKEVISFPTADNKVFQRNLKPILQFISLSLAQVVCASPNVHADSNDINELLETNSLDTINSESLSDSSNFVDQLQSVRPLLTDEYMISFNSQSLGLRLSEKYYKGFPIVTVKDILNENLKVLNPLLTVGSIVTKVNSENVDGLPLKQIAEKIKTVSRPLVLQFRDPDRFFKSLDSSSGAPLRVVSTSYLPANTRDKGAPEQIITVQRLELPPPENRIRVAQMLDVMEIQYIAQVMGSDAIVDSSAQRGPPGSSSRSIYYVLGQQNGPPGQFPPGWDLTLLGMVVGEKRKITLPSTLAYDRKGLKLNNIPPFATMIYTIKLISLT
eukprot:gene13327-17864_t